MKIIDPTTAVAAIAHLQRLANSNGGKVPTEIVRAQAVRLNCSERIIWKWLKDGAPEKKNPNLLKTEHLDAIAFSQGNLKRAWGNLHERNLYGSGYRQFVRAVQALDPITREALRFGVASGIQKGLFLKSNREGRLDRVIFDHTEADVRLQRLERGRLEMFRPWISLMIDSGTRFILAAVITEGDGIGGDPNTESLVALMATAIRGQYAADGTFVGGIPKLVQCDNARAHLANAMLSGFLDLQITSHLIPPGTPWHDGIVERLMRTFKEEFLATLPGYTAALPTRYAKDPWSPEDCLTMPEFKAYFLQWIDTYNYERRHSTLDSTPFEAWCQDKTVIDRADDALIRHAFLATSNPRAISKSGIRFENVDYTHADLAPLLGKKVTLKFLPNDRTFVDVISDGKFLCTAKPHSRLDSEERQVIVSNRNKTVRKVDHIIKTSQARASRRLIEGNPLLSPERDPRVSQRAHPTDNDEEFLGFVEVGPINLEGTGL